MTSTSEVVPAASTAARPLARLGILLGLVGAALFVDPWADDAFGAGKRMAIQTGALLVALAHVIDGARQLRAIVIGWRQHAPGSALALAGLALLLSMALATSASRSDPAAVTSLLSGLLFVTAPCLLATGDLPRILRWILLLVAVNMLLSLLQHGVPGLRLAVLAEGGRFPTGALLGNEGYVAMAAAIAGAAFVAALLRPDRFLPRSFATAGVLLAVAAILANRQVTALAALLVAAGVVMAIHRGWRLMPVLATLLLSGAIVAAGVLALRAGPSDPAAGPVDGVAAWNERTTYRLGAFAAATEMIVDDPMLGRGPGRFALEAHARRLDAEQRWQVPLVLPPNAQAFAAAHQEYLQVAAEFGVPVLLLSAGLLVLLLAQLRRQATLGSDPLPLALLGMLVTLGVLALAWIPLRVPLTGVIAALAFGAGIRTCGITAPAPLRGTPWITLPVLLLALAAFGHEGWRYTAEHRLGGQRERLDQVLAGRLAGADAVTAVEGVRDAGLAARAALDPDPRPALYAGVALLMLGDVARAESMLRTAIQRGERPELLVNYGRVRAAMGDDPGARASFLRAAFASDASVATLPRALRAELLQEVARRRQALRAGAADTLPPLPESLAASADDAG